MPAQRGTGCSILGQVNGYSHGQYYVSTHLRPGERPD
jgi:hypothetical protein